MSVDLKEDVKIETEEGENIFMLFIKMLSFCLFITINVKEGINLS